jgi:tRNA-Thr(GGU) m(6)t(6)A37 methyltransferase TsaA
MSLELEPIGYISTPFRSKADAPHQPDSIAGTEGIIRLREGCNFEQALEDLEGIEKIWLIYWFDRNPNWKPKVLVPRGPRQKRGVFATRSPYRPNPIGLSLVDLISIKGLELRVKNVDLLDGTPILDIKPYLPAVEAHPEASAGWIEEADATATATPKFAVVYSMKAKEQLQFLEAQGVNLIPRIERVLSHDPSPHPYKRIEQDGDSFVQAIRAWRVGFNLSGKEVIIQEVRSGYANDKFKSGEELSDDEAQRKFREFNARKNVGD